MWIFGYGSLMWYTNFPVEKRVVGRVKNYVRRFWQKSPDHRGTHEFPGRTVTLVPQENGEVLGIAFLVPEKDVASVREYLDFREKAGYVMQRAHFTPEKDENTPSFDLNVYISASSNENEFYAGEESIDQIANVVCQAVGPSGTNIEYVLRVADALRTLSRSTLDSSPDDEHRSKQGSTGDKHIDELEARVLRLCKEQNITDKCLTELGHV